MSPRDKCLATVRAVVNTGDVNGIGLAERAINDFVAAEVGSVAKAKALRGLRPNLILGPNAKPGPKSEMAALVLNYVDTQVRHLEEAE